jgi:hypothetical protein
MLKRSRRYIIATILTFVYAAIVLSPLAPLALRSAHVAHAVTGECVGDCDICGCSPERRASHTCCCWQKKLQRMPETAQVAGGGHDHGEQPAGCCRKKQEPEPVAECCRKKKRDVQQVLTCCPCGSSKMVGLWGAQKFEQLPNRFAGIIPVSCGEFRFHPFIDRLTDRHGDPPDPPPKLTFLS